jgi:uncharacterized protein YggT (Ycf19 family)
VEIALYLLTASVSALLGFLSFFMFLRAILSFIPGSEEWRVSDFLFYVTELAVAPVRLLMEKMGWGEGLPFDMSFTVAYLLIFLLQATLPVYPL